MRKNAEKQLKRGWTTGACAAAAAKAALISFIHGIKKHDVSIILPNNNHVTFIIEDCVIQDNGATCTIIKDAGDDPDITHQAHIYVNVAKASHDKGVRLLGGHGVGVVTKTGLPIAVGEPAITPKPREYITQNIHDVIKEHAISAHWDVTINIKDGDILALKTWNPRLGIEGGLSILGTTGIVIPYSCSAWIHSIHRGIDVAYDNNLPMIGAATGKTSERLVQQEYNLPDYAMIDMGDFAGGMLKYLVKKPIKHLVIGGGLAKITKLSQGNYDLHSSRSTVDFAMLARDLALHNMDASLCSIIPTYQTMGALWQDITAAQREMVAHCIATMAARIVTQKLPNICCDIMLIGRDGLIYEHYRHDKA